MKTFIRFFKIFFSLVSTVVVIGFIMITIQNYTVKEVEFTALRNNYYVKENYSFPSKIITKSPNSIEIKAEKDMIISDVMIKDGQILELGNEKALFTLRTEDYSSEDNESIIRYNEQISDIRESIDEELASASEFLGKKINSANELTEDQQITITAPANGKITGLKIGKDNKLSGDLIASIVNDSVLTIPFSMTPNEYQNINAGQEVLVSYTGYEGYYKGKIISVNPNAIPGPDNVSYIYTGVIEAENPGLIKIGVGVGVHIGSSSQSVSTLYNSAKVEAFAEQEQVKSPIYSSADKPLNVIKLNVVEGQTVKKGDQIAVLGGPAIADRMKKDAKSIKSKQDQIDKLRRDLDKEVKSLYGDLIKSNISNMLRIDEEGKCFTNERIYIDYVTGSSAVRKGEVILKYRLCGADDLAILATVDRSTYEKLYSSELMKRDTKVTYYDKEGRNYNTAKMIGERKFEDYYEVIYELQNTGYYKYTLNESLNLSVESSTTLSNVVPKTAIIPIEDFGDGKYCYVYVLEQEESMYGTSDVIRQKQAYIYYSGSDFVSIYIMSGNYEDNLNLRIVNNISTVLRDGMRVKAKK